LYQVIQDPSAQDLWSFHGNHYT